MIGPVGNRYHVLNVFHIKDLSKDFSSSISVNINQRISTSFFEIHRENCYFKNWTFKIFWFTLYLHLHLPVIKVPNMRNDRETFNETSPPLAACILSCKKENWNWEKYFDKNLGERRSKAGNDSTCYTFGQDWICFQKSLIGLEYILNWPVGIGGCFGICRIMWTHVLIIYGCLVFVAVFWLLDLCQTIVRLKCQCIRSFYLWPVAS